MRCAYALLQDAASPLYSLHQTATPSGHDAPQSSSRPSLHAQGGGGGEGGGGGGDYEGVRAAQQRLEGKIDEIYRMLRTQKTRDDA